MMASNSLRSLLFTCACLISSATALDKQLVGTWSTKSGKVLTGPGFYNPVNDSFIEPAHTGYSYSFTEDGFYESAYYRAVANPTRPQCPQAIMQFQHGRVTMNSDLSLDLEPFAVDGRQLQSDPCTYKDHATYTRYNQSELMKKWQVYTDPYSKMTRLDLYAFDGTPLHPMYLAFSPPQMLPTVTMNPTEAAPTPTGNAKRGLTEERAVPLNINAHHIKRDQRGLERSYLERVNLNIIWWTGVGMTIFGGAAYLL